MDNSHLDSAENAFPFVLLLMVGCVFGAIFGAMWLVYQAGIWLSATMDLPIDGAETAVYVGFVAWLVFMYFVYRRDRQHLRAASGVDK